MILIFKPKKRELDRTRLGVNCFYNVPEIGTMEEQSKDIKDMGINHIRMLALFDDNAQPSKIADVKLPLIKDALNSLQKGQKAFLVMTGAPSWIVDESDKIRYFVRFCKLVMREFANDDRVIGFQIGNEPEHTGFNENVQYGFSNPENYMKALVEVSKISREINPDKIIISAATTSIVQNWRDTLEYNEKLLKMNIEKYIDVYAIHYYGDRDFINLVRPNGALRFLKKIKRPIWVTEIGEHKFNEHTEYAKRVIPYLLKKVPNIQLFCWYQYDGSGTTESFGLKNANNALSRLYAYLINQ
jgi:hypothetical protein